MRPLIEILEDERTLNQKLESVYRFLVKTTDCETIDILEGQRKRVERDLTKVRNEIREYICELCEDTSNSEERLS